MLQRLFCAASAVCVLGCASDDGIETPPSNLLVDSPPVGAWIEESMYTVSGEARGMDSVEVNGVVVPVRDGVFETTLVPVHGVNLLEVSGIDAHGDAHFVRRGVLAGPFEMPKTMVEDAAMLRINRVGIEVLQDLVGEWVAPDSIAADAMEMNPIYQDSYGFMGWDAVTVAADIDSVSFSVPALTLTPRDGYLFMEAVIPNLAVDVGVYGDVASVGFDEPVWVTADAAILTSEIVLSASEGKPLAVLVDPTFTFDTFYMDTTLLPGSLEQALLGDAVQGQLEAMITDTIETAVPDLLESEIGGLNLTQDMELLGKTLTMNAQFGAIDVDSAGIRVVLDTQLAMPSASDKYYRGVLVSPNDLLPKEEFHSALYASFSDDLLNRALFEAWRGGLLTKRLATDDGSLPALALSSFHAEEGAVVIDALFPPVVTQRNQKFSLQIADLQVRVETPGGGMGDVLEASVTAFVDLDLFAESGEVGFGLGELDLHIMVNNSDWGASEEAITRVLEDNLPIEALLLLVNDFSYPIPSLAGISVETISLERDGSGVYTNVSVDLQ